MPLPNLIYIGPDKAGSTWLFQLLSHHKDAFVTPAKDLYFFDRYFDKGLEWYSRQFETDQDHQVIAEVSHDYLYSVRAAERMSGVLAGDARLMVCLREPVERAFSAYLYMVKCGQFNGTFEQAIERFPGLVDRGMYGKHLSKYLDYFPRERLIWTSFGQLRQDPQQFANQVFSRIGLSSIRLSEQLTARSLPAGQSRCVALTRLVRLIAKLVRDAGMPQLVGHVKTSRLVQAILFSSFTAANRPRMAASSRERLRDLFAPDARLLDRVIGTDLSQQWGYEQVDQVTPPQLIAV